MQISDVMRDIRRINAEHGWSSKGKELFCEKMLLVISEISEAVEEFRNGHELGEVYVRPGVVGDPLKPEGIPIEIADAIIRLFDWCEDNNINLENAIAIKLAYNASRPFRHGGKVI